MRRILLTVLVVLFIFTLSIPQSQVAAGDIIATGAILDMVNSLRTGNGLPALIVDSILNSTASDTAYTMAANGVCAHIGGAAERIAAAGFGGGATVFATENMACARSATIGWLQSVWADELHMLPMTDSKYTHVGAGSYTGADGVTYYVLHAAFIAGGATVYDTPEIPENPEATIEFIEPVVTATPQDDGKIIHTVKYGQALSTIAEWYGVTIEQIIFLNALTSNNIFVDQKLIIRLAPTVTTTPTRTATVRRPTRTPTLTPLPRTATPTRTITPTTAPNLMGALPKIDRQWLGLGILVASAIGLIAVLIFSFFKPKTKK